MLARILLAAVLLASPLLADPPKVGDDAPNFKAHGTIINPPEFERELKDCKGNVILIYEWHARDGTKSGLADIQKYHDKWKGMGLSIWTIHRLDFEKFPQIDIMARSTGWTFPICMGGFYDDKNDFFGYKDGKSFRACVVGSEGKVVWYGKDDGWKAVLEAEMAKLVYPNLGKNIVAEGAEGPAKKIAKREFGKALAEAEKMLAGTLPDAVKADVELAAKVANDLATARLDRVKAWKEDKRYDLVIETLTRMETEFKGHKLGDDAKEELKALKKDKDIKREIGVYENLAKLIDKEGKGDPVSFRNALEQFAKANPGTRAAGVAESMAQRIKADLE